MGTWCIAGWSGVPVTTWTCDWGLKAKEGVIGAPVYGQWMRNTGDNLGFDWCLKWGGGPIL